MSKVLINNTSSFIYENWDNILFVAYLLLILSFTLHYLGYKFPEAEKKKSKPKVNRVIVMETYKKGRKDKNPKAPVYMTGNSGNSVIDFSKRDKNLEIIEGFDMEQVTMDTKRIEEDNIKNKLGKEGRLRSNYNKNKDSALCEGDVDRKCNLHGKSGGKLGCASIDCCVWVKSKKSDTKLKKFKNGFFEGCVAGNKDGPEIKKKKMGRKFVPLEYYWYKNNKNINKPIMKKV